MYQRSCDGSRPSVEAPGEVDVRDLVPHTEVTQDGAWHSLTVCFHRAGSPESVS